MDFYTYHVHAHGKRTVCLFVPSICVVWHNAYTQCNPPGGSTDAVNESLSLFRTDKPIHVNILLRLTLNVDKRNAVNAELCCENK